MFKLLKDIAKNYKQLRNINHKINKEKSIGYDVLFKINVLAQELNCVKWVQSIPY